MNVPFFDLKRQYVELKSEIHHALDAVMEKTAFSGGPFVETFEKELAHFSNASFAIAVNSGTSALHLAMIALGIGPGDEVIVPANTFIASAWGVSYVGAKPVFVDIDSQTWNISIEAAKKAITPKTKAIIGVHLYGQPCNIDALSRLCKEYQIHFLEDNAQAIGAIYKNETVGNFGALSCTSFYPGKNLGAYGEGGAVITNNKDYAELISVLKNHGAKVRYYHDEIGYNMRMEGFQAAVLSVKLNYINSWNQKRQAIAKRYKTEILNSKVIFQAEEPFAESVYHLFVAWVEDRNAFQRHLESKGIGYAFHYPVPCHLQKAYHSLGYKKGDIPIAEQQAEQCISLPMFPEMTETEIEQVIQAVNSF